MSGACAIASLTPEALLTRPDCRGRLVGGGQATIDSLANHLAPTWDLYFKRIHESLALTDDEWWQP
jgi:hypothetical protein